MKELTKAEEQIMQILWKLEKGFVKDILRILPEPKPAYNTVSTIVRILEKKGFVSHKAFGKTHEYYPMVSKDTYKKAYLNSIVKNYFSDSFENLVSFFTEERDLSITELEELVEMIQKQINKHKEEDDDE